jgi:subtilisin family serine protease
MPPKSRGISASLLAALLFLTTFSAFADDGVGVIVEFFDAPRVLVRSEAATRTMARFREDVDTIVNARIAGKAALPRPAITHEYRNLVSGVAMTVSPEAIAEIRRLPYVKAVYRDGPIRLFDFPAAPRADAQLSADLTTIGADKVWAAGARGRGVVVALIDTGIDYTLPEFGGCLGTGCRVIGGYDFVNDDADPMDSSIQHGTAVASIIGGKSDRYTGVAPEVTFLGYRVATDAGILAALERAVDPNGDGNFSDHADVINLSIGTGGEVTEATVGNPSDLCARAVDNATAAGVVVVAAVGNEHAGHAISNPAMARTSIAVGLGGTDGVHWDSSRGPTPQDLTIKPELIAPGQPVWAVESRGLVEFGGTSAATPHVSGSVALLLELHPDWTPARVKQALMNTAATLPNDDVLSQGAGLLAVDRATTTSVTLDPPALSLGLYPLAQPAWTQTRTVRVANRGNATATFDVTASEVTGATVTVLPASVSVAAGASTDVTVTMTITQAATPDPLTFGVGGSVQFTSSSIAQPSLHVPWAAVKAVRATVVSDRPLWTVLWVDQNGAQLVPRLLSSTSNTVLVGPGQYDLFAWGEDNFGGPGTARLVYRPHQLIDGDEVITLTSTNAHTVTLDARDENGQPPPQITFATYAVSGRLLLPESFLPLPRITARTIVVDDLGDDVTLLLHETWYDRAAHKLYAVSHRPLAGLHAGTALQAGGAELERLDAAVYSIAERNSSLAFEVQSVLRDPGHDDAFGFENTVSLARFVQPVGTADPVDVSVFMTPDPHADYRSIVQLTATAARRQAMTIPPLRVIDGRIVAGSGSPALYTGDRLVLGRGVSFPRMRFNLQTASSKINVEALSTGGAGEQRLTERPANVTISLLTPGLQTVEVTTIGSLTSAIPRQSKATFTLDVSRSDFIPPLLTSLRLLGVDDQLATHLDIGGRGSLLLSAADYEYEVTANEYKPLRAEATKLWYRYHGAAAWTPLTLIQVLEDAGTAARLGEGILYRADLSSITAIPTVRRLVDLRIELLDVPGNTAAYDLESAFSIGAEAVPRHRGVGK